MQAGSKRILIMGLPGSGKTTLAGVLKERLEAHNRSVTWLNADEVRKEYDDWDFSLEGRLRQSIRMNELAQKAETDFVICDFVCPRPEMRQKFDPHYLIWMNTVNKSEYEDTNEIFVKPEGYSYKLIEKNAEKWGDYLALNIIKSEMTK